MSDQPWLDFITKLLPKMQKGSKKKKDRTIC